MSEELLLVSVEYLPNTGGVALMTHHLANGFAQAGVATRLLAPTGAGEQKGFEKKYQLSVDEHARPGHDHGREWRVRELPRLLNLFQQLLDEHPFSRVMLVDRAYYGPAFLVFCRQHSIPLVTLFDGSGMTPDAGRGGWFQRATGRGPDLGRLNLELVRGSDEILVTSSDAVARVKQTGASAPIRVIGRGLALDDFKRESRANLYYDPAQKRKLKRSLKLPVGKQVIGAICVPGAGDNLEMLIRAIADNPNYYGVIVGAGDGLTGLKALAQKHQAGERIKWIAKLNDNRKWRLLAALDVFCELGLKTKSGAAEGFSVALLEASAAGTPVIATRTGGAAEIVRPGHSGILVDAGDVAALTRGLELYDRDPDFAATAVENARHAIRDGQNWQAITKKLARHWRL